MINYLIDDFDKYVNNVKLAKINAINRNIEIFKDIEEKAKKDYPNIEDQNKLDEIINIRSNDKALEIMYSIDDKLKYSSADVMYNSIRNFIKGTTINKLDKSILFDIDSNPMFRNIEKEEDKIDLKLKLYDNYTKRLLNIFAEIVKDNYNTLRLFDRDDNEIQRIYDGLIRVASPDKKWALDSFYKIIKNNFKNIIEDSGYPGKLDFSKISKKHGGIVYYSNDATSTNVATRPDMIIPLAVRYDYIIIGHCEAEIGTWNTAGVLYIDGRPFTNIIDAVKYLILNIIAKQDRGNKPTSILIISCNTTGPKIFDKVSIVDRVTNLFSMNKTGYHSSLRKIVEDNNILLLASNNPLYSPFTTT